MKKWLIFALSIFAMAGYVMAAGGPESGGPQVFVPPCSTLAGAGVTGCLTNTAGQSVLDAGLTLTGVNAAGASLTITAGDVRMTNNGTFQNTGAGAGAQAFSTSTGYFGCSAASGNQCFAALTNGARFDFGAGANDYASSDGTTVTFSSPLTSTGILTGVSITASNGDVRIAQGQSFIMNYPSSTAIFYYDGTNTHLFTPGAIAIGADPSFVVVKPSLTGFGGTSPSITGTGTSFVVDVGTVAPGSSGTLTFATTATHGYNCSCWNETATPLTQTKASADTTTTCVITNYTVATGVAANWTASDKVHCIAAGY